MPHDLSLNNNFKGVTTEVVDSGNSLSQKKVEDFLHDGKHKETAWRYDASREADYCDGKQLDSEVLAIMEERGIPPLQRNLMGPAMEMITGMEANTRRDLRIVAERPDPDSERFAEAMNMKFKEAQKVGRFEVASSACYESQVKFGLGWLGVFRGMDPFSPTYRIEAPDINEMSWDWRANPDDYTATGRFVRRTKWFDVDELTAVFPKHADVIQNSIRAWADFDLTRFAQDQAMNGPLLQAFNSFSNTTLSELDWLDSDRDRVALYEIWYRYWYRGDVLKVEDRIIEFDEKNERHVEAVQLGAQDGRVTLETGVLLSKVRLTYWIGPHQIIDIPSPFPHNRFPYVPIFGFIEKKTGKPFGYARRMMSPQDEVNARLSKMMWLLSAKRIEGDSDAFKDSIEEVQDQVSRANAVILLDEDRKNVRDKPVITTDHRLADDQFAVMENAVSYISSSVNQFSSVRGQRDTGLEANAAIQTLIEQSATGLATVNAKYEQGRLLSGELLAALVKQDVMESNDTVQIHRRGRAETINLGGLDASSDADFSYRQNYINRTQTLVSIDEVPHTRTYKQQQFLQMSEVTKSAPEQLQGVLTAAWLKFSDLPVEVKEEAIANINRLMGLDEEGNEQEEQAKAERESQRIELETLIAENKKIIAEISNIAADTQLTLAKISETGSRIAVNQHEISVAEDTRQIDREAHVKEMKQPLKTVTSK